MKLQTRRSRKARERLKKAGIWVFLLVFVASIVGAVAVIRLR